MSWDCPYYYYIKNITQILHTWLMDLSINVEETIALVDVYGLLHIILCILKMIQPRIKTYVK
jgi:hypothetical protein